jgi:hypothetical protein
VGRFLGQVANRISCKAVGKLVGQVVDRMAGKAVGKAAGLAEIQYLSLTALVTVLQSNWIDYLHFANMRLMVVVRYP